MVLAIVLGGRAESSFRQAMIGSQGDLSTFWSNGLVGTITALSLFMLFWPAISALWSRLRAGNRGLKPAE
jgi:putative tricarboxylic transport membrane protein